MKNLFLLITLLIITNITNFSFGQDSDRSLKDQIRASLDTLNQDLKPGLKPIRNSKTKKVPPPGSVWRYPFDNNYQNVKIIPTKKTLPPYEKSYLKKYKKLMKNKGVNVFFTYREIKLFGISSIDGPEILKMARRTFFEGEEVGFCFFFTSREGRLKKGKDFNDKISFEVEIFERFFRKIGRKTISYREIIYGAKNFKVKYYKFSLGMLPPGSYSINLKIIYSSREEFEENSFKEYFDVLVRNNYQSKLKR